MSQPATEPYDPLRLCVYATVADPGRQPGQRSGRRMIGIPSTGTGMPP